MRLTASRHLKWLASGVAFAFLCGCTALAVTTTAVSVTASAVGLAADVAIGSARLAGKGIGAAADALASSEAQDASGIDIRYRTPEGTAWEPSP